MYLRKKPNGNWELRWREGGRRRSRSFDRKKGAEDFESDRRRRKQLGHVAVPENVPLREFTKIYWRLHALPNLAPRPATSIGEHSRTTSSRGSASTACAS